MTDWSEIRGDTAARGGAARARFDSLSRTRQNHTFSLDSRWRIVGVFLDAARSVGIREDWSQT